MKKCFSIIQVGTTKYGFWADEDNSSTFDHIIEYLFNNADKKYIKITDKQAYIRNAKDTGEPYSILEEMAEDVDKASLNKLNADKTRSKRLSLFIDNIRDNKITLASFKGSLTKEEWDTLAHNITLVGNSSLDSIRQEFQVPIDAADFDPKSETVLRVDSVDYKGIGYGNAINMGEDGIVYLVSNKRDAVRLASYFKVRSALSTTDPEIFNEIFNNASAEVKAALDYVREKSTGKKDLTVLSYFFKHSSEFVLDTPKVKINNQEFALDVYRVLTNFIKGDILENYIRRSYNDNFVDALLARSTWSKYSKSYSIPISLIKAIMPFGVALVELAIENATNDEVRTFWEDQKGKFLTTKKAKNDAGEEYEADLSDLEIIANIRSYFLDRGFYFKIKTFGDGIVYIENDFTTLEDSDFDVKTIEAATEVIPKEGMFTGGYHIYKLGSKFYVTPERQLTLHTAASLEYDTLVEAEKAIKRKLDGQLVNIVNTGLFTNETEPEKGPHQLTKWMPTGSTITLYKVPEVKPYLFSKDGRDGYISDANTNVCKLKFSVILQRIAEIIDMADGDNDMLLTNLHTATPEQIFLFISNLGDVPLNGEFKKKLLKNDVLPKLKEALASGNKYTVIDIYGQDHKAVLFAHKSLPKTEPSEPYITPMHLILSNIADIINAGKLKPIIHIITESEVNTYGVSASKVRGFIKDGEIYINSSRASMLDLYHEFAHLFFGIIKAKHLDDYLQLMDTMMKTPKFLNLITELQLDETYSLVDLYDLMEEAFVRLLTSRMQKRGKINNLTTPVEEGINSLIDKVSKALRVDIINQPRNFSELLNSMDTAMRKLITDDNGLLFDADVTKVRKASKVISDLIKKDKIQQDCTVA